MQYTCAALTRSLIDQLYFLNIYSRNGFPQVRLDHLPFHLPIRERRIIFSALKCSRLDNLESGS